MFRPAVRKLHSSCLEYRKINIFMKRFVLLLLIAGSIAACGNNDNNSDDVTSGADTTTTITSGNTHATMGQEIPRDSIEMMSDSTGNLMHGDSTQK